MCWVMPPASPATTSVSRIGVEQRRLAVVDVAHDRDDRRALDEVLVGVLELGLGVDVVGRVDDLDLLVELVGEDLDRVVGQRLGERGHLAQLHQLLDDLGHRHAEVLGDVLDRRAGVDADRVGPAGGRVLRRPAPYVGAAAPAAAAARRAALGAAAGRRAAGPPWRREAWESITTRRTPPPEPGARSPCSESRVGRCGAAGRRRPARRPARRRPPPGALGPSAAAAAASRLAGALRRAAAAPLPARARRERASALLVDGGRGGLDLDAGSGQPLQHLG